MQSGSAASGGYFIMFSELISYIEGREILILGFGREGRSTYEIIRRHLPDKVIGIADLREIEIEDANVRLFCGKNYLDSISQFDTVIKTPGISMRSVSVPDGVEITCQTDLFLRFSQGVCIGVTGTKGKTTTTTLIYQILKTAGKRVCLIGNMGIPVLDSLERGDFDYAAIEMSSHQLEFTTASPHIAVVTNIYPEHLDHYNGFEGYVRAKLNIFKYQLGSDYLVCTANQNLNTYCDFSVVMPSVIKVGIAENAGDAGIRNAIASNERMKGVHNLHNALMAATVARCLGIDDECIAEAYSNFNGIENRMEPVGEYRGIRFYNDSIATIPHAVECAVGALEEVDSLIFGGMDRGIDYSGFIKYLMTCPVNNLIGLPDTGVSICRTLKDMGCTKNLVEAHNMEEAVDAAFRYTEKGKICLMSPAASSYNVYRDFEEKGNHYKELIKHWQ